MAFIYMLSISGLQRQTFRKKIYMSKAININQLYAGTKFSWKSHKTINQYTTLPIYIDWVRSYSYIHRKYITGNVFFLDITTVPSFDQKFISLSGKIRDTSVTNIFYIWIPFPTLLRSWSRWPTSIYLLLTLYTSYAICSRCNVYCLSGHSSIFVFVIVQRGLTNATAHFDTFIFTSLRSEYIVDYIVCCNCFRMKFVYFHE